MTRILALVALSVITLRAQDFVVTTIAGADFVFRGDGEPATQAQLSQMYHVLSDAQGNLLIADRENHQIVSVNSQGILRIVAGNGIAGFSGDGGPALRASLNFPTAVALDTAGNIYIAEALNRRVRRVSRDGNITTVAGNGSQGSAGDGGPATAAQFDNPAGLAVDRAGTLYIADSGAHRVRRVTSNGIISTLAGNGRRAFSGDGGPGAQASIAQPTHLLIDPNGNLLICDWGNNRVRRVTPQGTISTIAGNGSIISSGDGGPATEAGFSGVAGVHIDAQGTLYVAEFFKRVRAIAPNGTVRTVAGGPLSGFAGDGGPATAAQLSALTGITGDAQGNLYIADSVNLRIRRVNSQGVISTVAGVGQHRFSGDGGLAVSASLTKPFGIAADAEGNVYISDSDNHRVRRIDPRGIITTFAGTGASGFSGDGGPANRAALNFPLGLAVDAAGNVYIADLLNNRVRRVNRAGIISTYAGGGTQFTPTDGTLASQVNLSPSSLAIDRNGTLFVMDRPACVIFRIGTDNRVSRYAGTYGECGSSGDGAPARNATIQPEGSIVGAIAVDPAGNLYMAEPQPPPGAPAGSGGRVRVIDTAGIIRPFAGNGSFGFPADDEAAVRSPMLAPQSAVANGSAGLIIGDGPFLYYIRPDGRIFRLAGQFPNDGPGDGGPALAAGFFGPTAIDIDPAAQRVVFADTAARSVRALLTIPPAAALGPSLLAFNGSSGGAVTAPLTLSLTAAIPGIAYAARVTGPDAPWLRIAPDRGTSPRLIEVSADPTDLAPGFYTTEITVDTPLAAPPRRTVAVTFRVGEPIPPRLTLDTESFSFTLPRDSAARTRALLVSNAGGGTAEFSIAATTTNGGSWLSVDSASGAARPGQSVSMNVTANPAGLAPGTYLGRIIVSGPGNLPPIPVTMTVSALDRAIQLSQTGFSFTTVSGGSRVPPQVFEVLSAGRGSVAWTVSVSTLEGGPWLSVNRTAGASDAASSNVPAVEVNVNQANLAPGVYYGLVRVDAPGAANSPQFITVGHEVLPAGSDPGPLVDPTELVFTAIAGASPSSKDAFVYNVAQPLKTFRSTGELAGAVLVTLPKDQTLELARPTRVVVQPFTTTLAPGTYRGSINLQFTDGRVRLIRIRVIVGGAADLGKLTSRAADACTPTKLVPAMTSLSTSSQITAGWPVPLNVEVFDDCGAPQEAGSVVVSFSNGDAPVPLQPLKSGKWAGTWATRGSTDNTTVKVEASDAVRTLAGTDSVTVGVRSTQAPPAVTAAGVVSTAGLEPFAPLTPGGLITITGERLADASAQSNAFPLPIRLGATRLLLGGRDVPLLSVAAGQISAIVPTGLAVNTRHQLLIQRGTTLSAPIALDMAPAQPAIFRTAASSRQGDISVVRDGAAPVLAAPANPAQAGDTIVIRAAGLGVTDPEIAAGQQTPANPPVPLAGSITLRIGGEEVPIDFAGLAPGQAAVYQIRAKVPAGITGEAVEVTLTRNDLPSPAVTMSIR